MPTDYKATLNLREAAFPMRASLPVKEPLRVAHWERIGLYRRMQERHAGRPSFVLHDGPPFTNGDLHLGHALNKFLKEIVNRYKTMRGFRTPYVPGWDCHGLPIEFFVTQKLQKEKRTLDTAGLRAECDAYSEGWIAQQRAQFQRLGVLGDWAREYRTKDPAYEAEILRTFAAFVEQGLVYRSKKPVLWSIPCETALAEAEIEYRDHVSPSVYVAFPFDDAQRARLGLDQPAAAVIWTTTPWTLPANLAIALHPQVEYVELRAGGKSYVVAAALAEAVARAAQWEQWEPGRRWTGAELVGAEARHPFLDRPSPLVLADYVTTESGTGLVHTAPGHGLEDYLTGLKYGLEIYSPLDDRGRYRDDGRIPPALVGVTVLETKGVSPANEKVLELLRASGHLLRQQRYDHSYPHCWRSKTPVVFRALDQWFVGLDRSPHGAGPSVRQRVLANIGQVQWIPAWGENRIRGAVESRPDWCVSRQRAWGVPIPAFFDAETGEALLTAELLRAVADKVETAGTNYWFATPAAQLAEELGLPADWRARPLKKSADTLDVWIDSGSSHRAVLQNGRHGDTPWPADLYLEGSDQHRGWFQSSLWTATVANGAAPFRQVLTHGFIVEASGEKLSKSKGAKGAVAWANEQGADVLRLWVASQDFRGDVPISDEIFGGVTQTYRLVRNTLRFLLSNTDGFDCARDAVPLERLRPVDRWALHQLAALVDEVTAANEAYEFHRAYQAVNRFCAVTLSATYHDLLKDRLYTLGPRSEARRAAQTVLGHVFDVLNRLLAPFLPFTADEAYAYAAYGVEFADDSVHLQPWPEVPAEWRQPALAEEFAALLKLRETALAEIQRLRDAKRIGQSLEAVVTFAAPASSTEAALLARHAEFLPELLIVSAVRLENAPEGAALAVSAVPAGDLGYVRCPRCWRWVPALVPHGEDAVCPRCAEALLPAS